MAIYKSATYTKGSRARPDSQVECAEFTATVVIPANTSLVAQDLIYFGKIGDGVDILQAEITSDSLANGTAITGTLGVVPATTAKTYTAVTTGTNASSAGAVDANGVGLPNFACILTATALNGASGIRKNITASAGGGTGDAFAINPYPVLAVVGDLVMTIAAVGGTQTSTVDRKITVRCKYQYAYPARYPTGVSDPMYPFAGSVVYGNPIEYNYGTAQNGTPNAP